MTEQKCKDPNCPIHDSLSTHGRIFTGTIVSNKMQRTAVVKWEWRRYLPKYERFISKTTKLKAHNPDCINVKPGDIVQIQETRPLSKTKNFVIIKKLGEDELYQETVMLEQEGKFTKKKKELKKQAEEVKEEQKE